MRAFKQQNLNTPFRIGVTSYVYPEGLVKNVEKTAAIIDDIELILFNHEGQSNIPTPKEIKKLSKLAQNNDLTYTIHFPVNLNYKIDITKTSKQFLQTLKEIYKLTQKLSPYAYIMHCEGFNRNFSESELTKWHKTTNKICQQIAEYVKKDRYKICLENLTYPSAWNLLLCEKYGFSICCDIGHLWLNEPKTWEQSISILKEKIRVVHLHGVFRKKDHISLTKTQKIKLLKLKQVFLKNYNGLITLEVFNKKDTFSSLNCIKNLFINNSRK